MWTDIYLTVILFPAGCLSLLACVWLLKWVCHVAMMPLNNLRNL